MTTRRLAAILAADMVGFSKLIGEDEAGTLAALREIRREIVNPVLAEYGGRIFKLMGDGMLAEFPSAVQALCGAIAIQEGLGKRNAEAMAGKRVEVRIGVHQGDVLVEGTDLLGDGVNIAARLEGLAEPGGICISARVHEDATGKIAVQMHDMGEQQLKNIVRPVRAYRILPHAAGARPIKTDPPVLRLPDKPSIAVLPFQNMSGDLQEEYFADGIVEDIITALSRLRWFFVIARNSSFTYKGKTVDVRQVSRDLGVRYVLKGSVRKAPGRLRITGQLIDATTGRHVWADRFDGDLSDVFELQDRMTEAVVGAIEPSLKLFEIERAKIKPTQDLDAYDLYLRALPELYLLTESGYRNAEAILRRAVDRDPSYSQAWAALTDCYGRMTSFGWIGDYTAGAALACDAGRRAVQADPQNGSALSLAAWALSIFAGQFDEAVDLANRALELHPFSAQVRTDCGWTFAYSGESDKALTHLQVARRLNPLDPRGWTTFYAMAAAHYLALRFEEAEKFARRGLEFRVSAVPLRSLAASLAQQGRINEARDVIAQLLLVQPNSTLARAKLAHFRHPWMQELWLEGLRKAGLPE
ncbi:MAG: adenylate/guanylate cyclase domain-containing protein [Hyphomicrobiales bacterium]|nr:adenylate/guanylate cyclase domain-containing protein [Hyphomicrobiales bacterium]